MKAVILAGGEGTRLRPLTLGTPKPIVPVLDRPFLRFQLDLLASVGVEDVVFSVGYQPRKIQSAFGEGQSQGCRIHYAVEESPLGTGGAVKYAEPHLDDTTIIFNGDVLTDVDLAAVVAGHRASGASATLVLAPVPNPAAYGLVETDEDQRVLRFIEKPDPSQITTDTINAGIYVLKTSTLSLIPPGVTHSIERGFFPALLARGDHVAAHVHVGYWIDIGTPGKYLQVHRDILDGRFPVQIQGRRQAGGWIASGAEIDEAAVLDGPFYIGPGCRVEAEARVGPGAVLQSGVRLARSAEVEDSILWAGCQLDAEAQVRGALLASGSRIGYRARVGKGAVLGAGTVLPDYSFTA